MYDYLPPLDDEGHDEPTYITSYTHTRTIHLGASAYGKTCVDCHGVSGGATAPGTSPHHDAVDSSAPDCAGCHDGGIASAPAGHGAYGTNCASCHTGMNRPSSNCSSCHVGRTGTTTPQITYTNTLACADAGCHGKVVNHGATPISAAPCSTCHAAHYQALGSCQTCHPNPQTFHHGTATARPLADCAGCHDGGIAAAPAGHGAYGTSCASCHTGMNRPSSNCSSCHIGKTGTTTPQITYTNTLACADAGCHGKVVNHGATPISAAPCSTCHTAHYQALGSCQTCHPNPQTFHHGTATARPLADCAGCHDGGIAADKDVARRPSPAPLSQPTWGARPCPPCARGATRRRSSARPPAPRVTARRA